MFANLDLLGEDNNTPTPKDISSILSPPGNYLSPASLESSSTSLRGDNVDQRIDYQKHSIPGSFLNDRIQPLDYLYNNNKTMTSPAEAEIKKETKENSTPPIIKTEDVSASNASTSDKKGHIAKRKYSRNGCTECKRRRMKCDETKPICWQCARLNRECVYILNSKNKKRKNKDKPVPSGKQKSSSKSSSEEIKDSTKESASNSNSELKSTLPNTNPETQPFSHINSHLHDLQKIEVPNLVPPSNMDGYDVNLLMQNLNDMVNMKLNDSFLLNEDFHEFNLPDLIIPELMGPAPLPSTVPISFLINDTIIFNTDVTSLKLDGIHDKYLKVFYYDCLDSIAPFFQEQANPLRDILLSFAKKESYLLSALLAIGASITYRRSNNLEDEKNYCAYLSHCLSLLGEQFQNESNVIHKIEPIILTVIMLAWDCIYTMNSQWRSHLKGVTDLFKKINAGKSSKVINVAKCWFKVMETFASVSTVLGGSIMDDNDLDVIFDPYDYQYVDSLKYLNIMTPLNEFNLLRGHKEDFDLVIKEVIKGLNSIRRSEKNDIPKDDGVLNKNQDYLIWSAQPNTPHDKEKGSLSYFEIQKILVDIDKQLEYEFIDKSGIIPPHSQSHPDNSHIEDYAINLVTLRNGKTIAISWYDISHQTQVLSFLLIVLLKLLGIPKESPIVQQVVKRLLSFFSFLDSEAPPHNSRTCYCNFAVLIAGLNAIDEETRDVVRKYYDLNGKKFQRLTEHNLNRLEKVWYSKEGTYKMVDQDVLTW
ncbi:Lys14p NDAI_0A05750 [Naumovozyma dairenensis CBS 421]|uniref:Zn(2)-C6 fungal-type domain-containing protein n=1 Tax=Naumovozyma dairenensis (strain ATCC 10597 / BCRC 20456 / CBS 421 / NBRC 0211 / NRRL Y-12639) TaxID=1071378 RepID=G0W4J2_NAUDC|nr:hypothetical protein NDAI_0A05750 [Naumovozyma dairenensis CBS 421]CCD22730.1 hypothetical protein NDAI_0A05750 [Naumovozyma dairenensis CBS 421]